MVCVGEGTKQAIPLQRTKHISNVNAIIEISHWVISFSKMFEFFFMHIEAEVLKLQVLHSNLSSKSGDGKTWLGLDNPVTSTTLQFQNKNITSKIIFLCEVRKGISATKGEVISKVKNIYFLGC